jgi:hypothetical protein
MGNEFERGLGAIKKNRDRNEKGHTVSEQREPFDTGWDTGRLASDPEDPSTAKDIVKKVRGEYKPLGPDARKAYREGYASGSDRGGEE